jgi:hypothetical protein
VPTHEPAASIVTEEQVERAVLQLRERPGMSAVEQIHAVLRELGLTVRPAPTVRVPVPTLPSLPRVPR